jgi:murein DD-endopeptidase MepM/ murein hydrolase activator NlpD
VNGHLRIVLWWVLAFFLYAFPCSGGETVQVSWSPHEVKQGDVLSVIVKPEAALTSVAGDLDETPIYFYEQAKGVLAGIAGVDLAALPGHHSLRVAAVYPDGRPFEQVFAVEVEAGGFEVQRLTLTKEMVELKGKLLERYLAEHKRIKEVLSQVRPQRLWSQPFIRPVDGPITSAFGLRRILNGEERSPHSGVDIGAPLGAEVLACNSGIVVFARELYLEGKTIIMDHGFGLYSIYMHLSEMRVKERDTVGIGDCIGLVGATGRVTGPHLHWGIKLLGARVDPFSLLRAVSSGE